MSTDVMVVLKASISDFQAKMAQARGDLAKTEADGSASMQKLSTLGKGALAGIAAGAVAVGVVAVDMADKQEIAQGQLEASLKSAGISWNTVSKSVGQTGQSMAKYGFTQAQIDGALQQGVISTQNYDKAHRNLTIAVQLAAAKHIDLATAMTAVDKAATGQQRPLKMLGIDLPIVASSALKVKTAQDALAVAQSKVTNLMNVGASIAPVASKAHLAYQAAVDKVSVAQDKLTNLQSAGNQILNALQQRMGGQAAAAANTFQGQLAAAKAEGENMFATLGLKLIPVLTSLVKTIMGVVNWFQQHKTIAEALAVVVGTVVVAAIVAFTVSLFAAGGALAFITGPIALVIVGVALLAVGAIYLATHWKQVWSDIKHWFDDAVQFLTTGFGQFALLLLGPIAPLAFLALHWQQIWGDIKGFVQDAWNFIDGIFQKISNGVQDVTKAIGTVTKFLSNPVGGIASALGFAEGGMIPGAPGQPVPILAHGGEYVLPQRVVAAIKSGSPPPAGAMSGAGGAGASNGAGGGQVINNNITAITNADAHDIAAELVWAMKTSA